MCCKNIKKTIVLFKRFSFQLTIKKIHFCIIYWDKFNQMSINNCPEWQKPCITDAFLGRVFNYSTCCGHWEWSLFFRNRHIHMYYTLKMYYLVVIYSLASIPHSRLFFQIFLCQSVSCWETFYSDYNSLEIA